jgi:uncharacterized membrane protein
MFSVEKQITIQAAPEDVWEYCGDANNELAWRKPWTAELTKLDEGPLKVGSQFHGVTKVMGQTDTYTNEVTEYDPPKRMAWESVDVSGPMTGKGSYTLEPVAEQTTRFTLAMTYMPRNMVGTLMQPLGKVIATRVIVRSLNNLKTLCETQ